MHNAPTPHRRQIRPRSLSAPFVAITFAAAVAMPGVRAQEFTVLRHLTSATDGGTPRTAPVQGDDLSIFFAMSTGGSFGGGTILKLNPDGTGTATIHHFTPASEGSMPLALLAHDGRLFGVANAGGANSFGTVFVVDPDGANFTVLHHFAAIDGRFPTALIRGSDGALYGTTGQGTSGGMSSGTVFRLTTNGGTFSVIHNAVGLSPVGLAQYWDDRLFVTCNSGGSQFLGTVVALDTDGGNPAVIANFGTLGLAGVGNPGAPAIFASDGLLYGTTTAGGAGSGCFYSMETNGDAQILRNFNSATDGTNPESPLIEANGGPLFGTLRFGVGGPNGRVFRVEFDGSGFEVVHAFAGASDGSEVRCGLLAGADGRLYGATASGGANGGGTIFAYLPPAPPTITSALTATGTVSESFTYTITADQSPTEYSATDLPAGLTINTLTGVISGTPTEGGSFSVTLGATNALGTGTATLELYISQALATVTLGNLAQIYDGTPRAVTATTDPAGLAVVFTYNGSSTPPTSAGSYSVQAAINDPNYAGSATGTLEISKGTATINIGYLVHGFDGTPKTVAVAVTPSGNSATVTYDGSTTPPSAIGTYAVVASIPPGNPNLEGSATATMSIVAADPTNNLATVEAFNPAPNGTPTVTVVEASGGVLIGGTFATVAGQSRFGLARLDAAGALDTTFVPTFNGPVLALAVQPDTKILVGGFFTTVNGQSRGRIARLNPDGTLDTSFNPGAGANNIVWTMALQRDGRVIIGGDFGTVAGTTQKGLARLNADGSIDPTFVFTGPPVPGFPTFSPQVQRLALQSDGKLMVSALFFVFAPRPNLVRVNADGSVDPTFPAMFSGHVIAAQPDGRILVTSSTINGHLRRGLARLEVDGSLDTAFDPGADSAPAAFALQADGAIVAVGSFTEIAGQPRQGLARLAADGTLDATFAPGANGTVQSVTIAGDGRVVIAGSFSSVGGQPRDKMAILAPTAPAISTLVASNDGTSITWLRGGTAPEILFATFEQSADGVVWTPIATLNPGAMIGRVGTTSDWLVDGLDLPADVSVHIRARGVVPTTPTGSSGLVETVATFTLPQDAPVITSTLTASGSVGTSFGYAITATNGPTSFNAVGLPAGLGIDTGTGAISGTPTVAGNFSVQLEATNAGGTGIATLDLTIAKATATVVLSDLAHTYSGSAKAATASTTPSGLGVTILYDGSSALPINAGSYAVTASIADANYEGTATGTLTISPASVTIAISYLVHAFDGTPKAVATATTPLNTPLTITYDGSATAPSALGSYGVIASASGPNFQGSASATMTIVSADPTTNLSLAEAFDPAPDVAPSVVVEQSDGKLLVGGNFTNIAGQARSFLARLDVDGSLDASFAPVINGLVQAIAVQPDGRIVIGGSFTNVAGQARNRIARLNQDGSLDATFVPGTGVNNPVVGIVLQPDGRCVIAGVFSNVAGQTRRGVARLHVDGSLDTGFSFTFQGGSPFQLVAPAPDGKFLVGGLMSVSGPFFGRLNANGSKDNTFLNEVLFSGPKSARVLPDGRIMIGGPFTLSGVRTLTDMQPRNRIARLNADGTLDGTFDPGADASVNTLAVQVNGAIIAAGDFTEFGTQPRQHLARFDAAGALDPTFDPSSNGNIAAIALRSDGRLVVAGSFTSIAGQARTRLALLTATGPAAQALVASSDRASISWLRGGTTPEISFARFEQSSDGVTWTDLTVAHPAATIGRVGTTSDWLADGLDLPTGVNVHIRARGIVPTASGGSSGLVETVVTFVLPPDAPVITSTLTASGAVGASFSYAITATNTPTSFNAVGLPAGLVIDTGTGAISGTPALAGNFSVQLEATNSGGTGTATLQLAIAKGTATVVLEDLAQIYNGTPRSASASTTPGGLAVSFLYDGFATPPTNAGSYAVQATINDANYEGSTSGTLVIAKAAATVSISYLAHAFDGTPKSVATSTNPFSPTLTVTYDGSTTPPSAIGAYVVVATINAVNYAGSATATLNIVAADPTNNLVNAGALTGTPNADPLTVATQSDGKVLVGGPFTLVGGVSHPNLARFNLDGSLDSAFAPSIGFAVQAIAVQPDGRILVAGATGGIARLNTDGSPDTTFTPASPSNTVRAIALQPDGRILIGGSFNNVGGVARKHIARLNSDGTLDTSFVYTAWSGPPSQGPNFQVILVQPDSKILVAGLMTVSGPLFGRLNANGSIDSSFVAEVANGAPKAALLQPDGKIVIAGTLSHVGVRVVANMQARSRIARLNADGTLDASFDPGANGTVNALALQADGAFIAAGDFTEIGGQPRLRLARLNANGALDASFDPQANASVAALALTADGSAVAAGSFTMIGGQSLTRLARLSATAPATQALIASSDGSSLSWLRGGSAPELSFATFEFSFDGVTWSDIASVFPSAVIGRVGTTSDWLVSGTALPAGGGYYIRARGVVAHTQFSSSSVVEFVKFFLATPLFGGSTIASGTVGVPFAYMISATNMPTSYGASGLPAGLTFDTNAGVISGTPMQAGGFAVNLTATNAAGTSAATLDLQIAKASASIALGNLAHVFDGLPKSASATTTPVGLAVDLIYDGSPIAPTAVGSYLVAATIDELNYEGTASATLVITAAPPEATPVGTDVVSVPPPLDENGQPAPDAPPVVLSFDSVTAPGTSSVTVTADAPVVPVGFMLSDPPLFLEIHTTATFNGFVEVAVDYSGLTLAGDPSELVLMHYVGGSWVDITTTNDTTNRIIYGLTNSFSRFALFESATQPGTARVRHAPILNGRLEGSLQQMLAENVTFNSGGAITGNLFVPGTPTLRVNGTPTFGGTINGSGSASPTNFTVTLNSGATLGHLVRRTNAVAMPVVNNPPNPTGTNNVSINSAGQSVGSWAALRNLTLNSNAGNIAVPPGTYGDFTANGTSSFTLGVAGTNIPVVYHLQRLTLNSAAEVRVVGPVILVVRNAVTVNGTSAIGSATRPAWMRLQISSSGLTLNGSARVFGFVTAPAGTVVVNSPAQLIGGVTSDRLTINGSNSLVRILAGPSQP